MPTTGDLKEMVVRYIDYIRSVRGYSPLTVRHYELVLNEAARYWEIEEREEGVLLSLMPWRIAIANQARATIARKVSTVRSFVAWLNEEGMVVMLKGGELAKQRRNLPRP
ncbi:MAG: site-specific integrase, partial [Campylobacterales bacterium]